MPGFLFVDDVTSTVSAYLNIIWNYPHYNSDIPLQLPPTINHLSFMINNVYGNKHHPYFKKNKNIRW